MKQPPLINLALFCVFLILKSRPFTCKLFPIAVRLPLNGTAPDLGGSIWPKPLQMTSYADHMFIDWDTFQISYSQHLDKCQREIIENLWLRYKNILRPPKFLYQKPSTQDNQLKRLVFDLEKFSSKAPSESCAKAYYPMIQDTDTEAYELSVDFNEAKLLSKTVWGLIRGLETFAQLTYIYPNTNKVFFYD